MFPASTRVLVIDDMSTMRKIVCRLLKEIGFTDISEAADGNQAWELINSSVPPIDLIISDWNMPVCTGLELLKRVRKDPKFTGLPFILVTAEAEQSQIIEAVKSGVSGYVVKPFSGDTIKTKLEAVHQKFASKAK